MKENQTITILNCGHITNEKRNDVFYNNYPDNRTNAIILVFGLNRKKTRLEKIVKVYLTKTLIVFVAYLLSW